MRLRATSGCPWPARVVRRSIWRCRIHCQVCWPWAERTVGCPCRAPRSVIQLEMTSWEARPERRMIAVRFDTRETTRSKGTGERGSETVPWHSVIRGSREARHPTRPSRVSSRSRLMFQGSPARRVKSSRGGGGVGNGWAVSGVSAPRASKARTRNTDAVGRADGVGERRVRSTREGQPAALRTLEAWRPFGPSTMSNST